MAFIKHGKTEKLDVIGLDGVDSVVCKNCNRVLIRARDGSKIAFTGGRTIITCKCGETTNV